MLYYNTMIDWSEEGSTTASHQGSQPLAPSSILMTMRSVVCGYVVAVGRSGSAINEVNLRRARLVLRWVTTSGFNSWCLTFISVRNKQPRSTQPGHPFVGRRNDCAGVKRTAQK